MYKNLQTLLLASFSSFFLLCSSPVSAVSPGYMAAQVINKTHYQIKISVPWGAVYGSTASHVNNNPIAPGKKTEVVVLDKFDQATKYQAAYDVWDEQGSYLGNCTLMFQGYPQAFSEASSNQYCTGAQSGYIAVNVSKEKAGILGDEGVFTFTISSDK